MALQLRGALLGVVYFLKLNRTAPIIPYFIILVQKAGIIVGAPCFIEAIIYMVLPQAAAAITIMALFFNWMMACRLRFQILTKAFPYPCIQTP